MSIQAPQVSAHKTGLCGSPANQDPICSDFEAIHINDTNSVQSRYNAPNSAETWHKDHIVLRWDLRDPEVSRHDKAVYKALFNIFPTTRVVYRGEAQSYISFVVDQLPSRPWPKTVAGLPITIFPADGTGPAFLFRPPPSMVGGSTAVRICQGDAQFDNEAKWTAATIRALATKVTDHVRDHVPQITVHEVVFTWEHHLYVLVDDDFHLRRPYVRHLAGFVGSIRVLYARRSELGNLSYSLQAKRTIEPNLNTDQVDDSPYSVLRPGVVISSRQNSSINSPILSTCSGILVRDRLGEQYMTAATHGIGPSGTLFLPRRAGTPIGKAAREVAGTDITLVELADGISFVNAPFESHLDDVPTTLSRLASEQDICIGNNCDMETPQTGILCGSVTGLSFAVEESRLCNAHEWIYFGQDHKTGSVIKLPDSVCGSAVWDDCGIVYGFYHFYAERGRFAGMSFATSASALSEEGITIV